jgi:Rps23 Pro-64 3,4-dihydroxylase Tpa1-like proline 4-hydroxylase
MNTNSLFSNLQLFPELSQAIENFAQRKKINFQTAIIELLTIGLEQVDPNYKPVTFMKNNSTESQQVSDLEKIIGELTGQLIEDSNLNVNPEVVKNLTLEILQSQLNNLEINQSIEELENQVIPSNYVQIPDFLTPKEQEKLIKYCLANKKEFVPTTTSTEIDSYRRSKVLYYFSEFKKFITNKIEFILPDILTELEIADFELTEIESQITAHNHGDFYKIHNDNGSPDSANRLLTYVYYFYQEPKAFSGGELKIYDSKEDNNYYVAADSYKVVEPINNSIIFFLSRYMHEVLPVQCVSQNFADSRFTINGWIRGNIRY